MATASSRLAVGWVAGLAALLALLAVAGAGTITFFELPGCAGKTQILSDCDTCTQIDLRGGYDYVNTHLNFAILFPSADCSDPAPTAKFLSKDEWHCSGFHYKSVSLLCLDGSLSSSSSGSGSGNITKAQRYSAA